MRVLIVGGGVIGASVAYQLAARGADAIVLERSAIGCAASGKSGGFLIDMFGESYPSCAPRAADADERIRTPP